jgi:radical SAM superfamily enzyme YgiQ (UPF0313 family)
MLTFCRELQKRRLAIRWSIPVGTRAEAIDREVADLLMATGCTHVTYAPESASPRILAAVEKKVDLARMERAIRDSLDAGLIVCLFMIVGFPQEKPEDMRATRRWLRRMARLGVHEVAVATFVPLPGTRLFQEIDKTSPLSIDDEFCYWMTGTTSLTTVRSWNPDLTGPQLLRAKLLAMGGFFLTSYLWHPDRFWRLLANAVTGRQETKVDRVIQEFLMKLRALTARSGRP